MNEPVDSAAPAPTPGEPQSPPTPPAGPTGAAPPALGVPRMPRPRLPRAPAPPASSGKRFLMYLLLLGAGAAFTALLGLVFVMVIPSEEATDQIRLGKEFRDSKDDFIIQPPLNWTIHDRVEGTSVCISGPREKGFSPLITVCLQIAPGSLESYLEEHLRRLQHEDPSVKILDQKIFTAGEGMLDQSPTARIEYRFESPEQVQVRVIQYLIADKPRFYRITSSAAEDVVGKYQKKFEASAKSFKRIAVTAPTPKVLPE